MSDDAERFRRRARQCRELAVRARDDEIRLFLLEVAGELTAEADSLDTAGIETGVEGGSGEGSEGAT